MGFANVLASGINLTKQVDLDSRRNRFIMAFSLALGVGVTVWPYAFLDRRNSPYSAPFWKCDDCSAAMKGVRNGVSIFLSTGYCVGSVAAILLNCILPADVAVASSHDSDEAASPEDDEDGSGTTTTKAKALDSHDGDDHSSEVDVEKPAAPAGESIYGRQLDEEA